MRVLILTLRSDMGGGPRHVFDLLKAIRGLKDVQVFLASPLQAPFGPVFKCDSAGFIELPHRSFSLSHFFRLIRFCQENKIEVIHSHGRGAGIYSRLLKFFGYPIVHTYHGIHIEKNYIGRVKYFVDLFLERLTDTQIFVSNDEFQYAQKHHLGSHSHSVIINNGIPTPEKRSSPSVSFYRLGTIARLAHIKGIDNLLHNFSDLLKSSQKPYQLFIAGDGEDRITLTTLVKSLDLEKSVTFLGEVKEPYSFLSSIDIYVSASRREGLPLSILEAMSFGLPCVLSEVPGHQSFIERNAALGFNDSKTFAHQIQKMNFESSSKLIASASNYIREFHSHETQVKNTVSVYRGLLPTQS